MDRQLLSHRYARYDNGNPKVRYPDYYIIPFLSLGIGYLMVQLGYNGTWSLWDDDPEVRKSMLSSILCTATVLLTIAICNRYLDRILPWRKAFIRRIAGQFLFCVFIPALMVGGWQDAFFRYMGTPFLMEMYMEYNYPSVRWMLLIWSILFYGGIYYYAVPADPKKEKMNGREAAPGVAAEQAPKGRGPASSKVNYSADDIVHFQEVVGCILAENKKVNAYYTDGSHNEMHAPVSFFSTRFDERFYLLRTGVLVGKDAIERVEEMERCFLVTLKKVYLEKQFETAWDKKTAFRNWWDGSIDKKSN